MELVINGKKESRTDELSVQGLLADLGLDGSPCAVEVNREVVPKARHAETMLRDGDRVELMTLVGGG